ncbi:MAG: hypothetical protein PHY41_03690 [Candidatus Cloacimonetes bacterium]|jgi:hypothetical protein|nr:hypothetical protein [Candidatus Cloacimonadota bacterium]MDY0298258.1 hypothetical protein [Candidatus Cloacimonadaceae bacterium]MCB5278105.1 hypothetical protein [Candidatus Cloacimonadota bacterium]MCK9333296.1 hypothetical protein [Candidatus Cloacimonadota bacterium]MDD2209818.1 hypothetical protein [Candidatus Cloacimonadota bacterium]
MKQDKRSLAAISAVLALISGEERHEAYSKPITGNASHPWAAYARSQTMQYRDITQRRIIKRSR